MDKRCVVFGSKKSFIVSPHGRAGPHDNGAIMNLQANGFEEDEGEASACDTTDCGSIRISGCHEAVETRTIRFKITFFNDTSPQLQPG